MKKNKNENLPCTYLVLIFLSNLPAAWLAGWTLYYALMQLYKKKLLNRHFHNRDGSNLRREIFINAIKIRAPNVQ